MDAHRILSFQRQLAVNNNREWFNAHKDEYLAVKADLDAFTQSWLDAMEDVDPELSDLTVKDCTYRIYRDTRFSADKTPYKNWIGIILAPHGGRKSPYGCYYLHFQPDNCMFAAGVYFPESEMLKALRQDIYDNTEELEEIFARPEVAQFFTTFDAEGQQKKIPAQFPKDYAHPDWLARKSFTISVPLSEAEMAAPDLLEHVLTLCRAAKPINDFLNYTIDAPEEININL